MFECDGESTDRVKGFLVELEELCIKYRLTIGSEGGGHIDITDMEDGDPCLLSDNGVYDRTDN